MMQLSINIFNQITQIKWAIYYSLCVLLLLCLWIKYEMCKCNRWNDIELNCELINKEATNFNYFYMWVEILLNIWTRYLSKVIWTNKIIFPFVCALTLLYDISTSVGWRSYQTFKWFCFERLFKNLIQSCIIKNATTFINETNATK